MTNDEYAMLIERIETEIAALADMYERIPFDVTDYAVDHAAWLAYHPETLREMAIDIATGCGRSAMDIERELRFRAFATPIVESWWEGIND